MELFAQVEAKFGRYAPAATPRFRFCRIDRFESTLHAVEFADVLAAYLDPPLRFAQPESAPRQSKTVDAEDRKTAARAIYEKIRTKAPELADTLKAFLLTCRHAAILGWRSGVVLSSVLATLLRRRVLNPLRQARPSAPTDIDTAVPATSTLLAAQGDVLVCLGASWINPKYAETIAELKRRHGFRFALLVYDLIPIVRPEFFRKAEQNPFRHWFESIVPLTDYMMTISDYSRAEVLSYTRRYDLPTPPVETLRLGNGFTVGRKREDTPDGDRSNGIPKPFVMFVSTIEIRKNHALLFRIWIRLLEEYAAERIPTLVFVGRPGWLTVDFQQQLENVDHLNGKILQIADLSDSELEAAYRDCLFTVYPSHYEGWGLPVAESILAGKYCLASCKTSIPEIGRDALDYFDPDDFEAAYRRVEELIFDTEKLRHAETTMRARFVPTSWAQSADDLAAKLGRVFGSMSSV